MPTKEQKTYPGKGEMLTVRLSPKMRYGLELLSRRQHRTLSATVQNLLDREIRDKLRFDILQDGIPVNSEPLINLVWDPLEPDSLVKLAMHNKPLLEFDEELRWKVIEADKRYWRGEKEPNYEAIRKAWSTIVKKAEESSVGRKGH